MTKEKVKGGHELYIPPLRRGSETGENFSDENDNVSPAKYKNNSEKNWLDFSRPHLGNPCYFLLILFLFSLIPAVQLLPPDSKCDQAPLRWDLEGTQQIQEDFDKAVSWCQERRDWAEENPSFLGQAPFVATEENIKKYQKKHFLYRNNK